MFWSSIGSVIRQSAVKPSLLIIQNSYLPANGNQFTINDLIYRYTPLTYDCMSVKVNWYLHCKFQIAPKTLSVLSATDIQRKALTSNIAISWQRLMFNLLRNWSNSFIVTTSLIFSRIYMTLSKSCLISDPFLAFFVVNRYFYSQGNIFNDNLQHTFTWQVAIFFFFNFNYFLGYVQNVRNQILYGITVYNKIIIQAKLVRKWYRRKVKSLKISILI